MRSLYSQAKLFRSPVSNKEYREICLLNKESRYYVGYREVVQKQIVCSYYSGSKYSTNSLFGIPIFGGIESLYFKSVEAHKDEMWEYKGIQPYFIHQVIKGSFDLVTHDRTITYKRGDVFYMNPQARHEVRTNQTCITKTAVTGKKHICKWLMENSNKL